MFPDVAFYLLIYYYVQAAMDNTRANDILKQAPFLVPFTSRVKIFTVSNHFTFKNCLICTP